jgi:hypothetical protein
MQVLPCIPHTLTTQKIIPSLRNQKVMDVPCLYISTDIYYCKIPMYDIITCMFYPVFPRPYVITHIKIPSLRNQTENGRTLSLHIY